MTESNAVDSALKQLSSVSKKLNEASDKLSMYLAEVESHLASYKLGVTAWVDLQKEERRSDPDKDGRSITWTHVEMLGYGKHNGKWGLLVASWCEETFEGDADTECFLRDAPRETRLAAVEKLPDLLRQLTKEATQIAEETTRKAEKARQIAAGLGKPSR